MNTSTINVLSKTDIPPLENTIINPITINVPYTQPLDDTREFIGKQYKCIPQNRKLFTPFERQYQIFNYFFDSLGQNRGLILYHSLGTGKTCTSIMIADQFLKNHPDGIAYILTPGSLRQNFLQEYCTLCGKNSIALQKRYRFITYNYTQIIDTIENYIEKKPAIFIIDEYHNIINGATHESKQKTAVYNFVLNSLLFQDKSRVLLLSGTPIWKSEKELKYTLQLIKDDYLDIDFKYLSNIKKDKKIKDKTNAILSVLNEAKDIIASAYDGIVSYIPITDTETYPKELPHITENIQITEYQKRWYEEEKKYEEDKLLKLNLPDNVDTINADPEKYKIIKQMIYIFSSMLISRPLLNFVYFNDIMQYRLDQRNQNNNIQIEGDTEGDDGELNMQLDKINEIKQDSELSYKDRVHLEKLKNKQEPDYPEPQWFIGLPENKIELLQNLESMYSPKFAKLIHNIKATNINEQPNAKHVVYSWFKSRSGVDMLCSIFNQLEPPITFLRFTGDLSSDNQRQNLLNKFNDINNMHGQLYQVLILTRAGAEGINVMHCPFVHIMNPDLNINQTKQVIGRVIRANSHKGLDTTYANTVQVIEYISIDNESGNKTSDELAYDRSINGEKITNNIIQKLQDISLEKHNKATNSNKSVNFELQELKSKCKHDLQCISGCCKGGCVASNFCVKNKYKKSSQGKVLSTQQTKTVVIPSSTSSSTSQPLVTSTKTKKKKLSSDATPQLLTSNTTTPQLLPIKKRQLTSNTTTPQLLPIKKRQLTSTPTTN